MGIAEVKLQIVRELVAEVRSCNFKIGGTLLLWGKKKVSTEQAMLDIVSLHKRINELMDDLNQEGY